MHAAENVYSTPCLKPASVGMRHCELLASTTNSAGTNRVIVSLCLSAGVGVSLHLHA
jgi:hypothetical protein